MPYGKSVPDQEVCERCRDHDPGSPHVVLGVEQALLALALVLLAAEVAGQVVALGTIGLPEAVPPVILWGKNDLNENPLNGMDGE